MNLARFAAALGFAALVAACATPWEVADVNEILEAPTPSVGTPFTKALFEAYKVETIEEAKNENEWDHASIFARKGLKAAQGEVVAPATFDDWFVPEPRDKELTAARARLVGYLANGAPTRVPVAAAKAQAKFDCWMEEEAEGEINSDCRAAFLKLEPELQVKPAPAPVAQKKIVKTFIVYFDFNKASITKDAQKILKDVVAANGEIKPSSIYVAGHTDTVGKSAYNDALSAKRAEAVAKSLAKLGVSTKVDQKSFGFTKLAVPTKSNVKEAKNRRVEIYFEK